MNVEELNNSIDILVKKASREHDGNEAMKYSQAALNLANTYNVVISVDLMAAQYGKPDKQ